MWQCDTLLWHTCDKKATRDSDKMGCQLCRQVDRDLAVERKRISSIKVKPVEDEMDLAMQNKYNGEEDINHDEKDWEQMRDRKTSIHISTQM